jgi:hypothetical protein
MKKNKINSELEKARGWFDQNGVAETTTKALRGGFSHPLFGHGMV